MDGNFWFGTFGNDTPGGRLQSLREGKETQQELADSLGVSRSLVKEWERGTRLITTENLVQLARHFGVTTDYILCLTDTRSTDESMKTAVKVTGLSEQAIHSIKNLNKDDLSELLCCEEFTTLVSCLGDLRKAKNWLTKSKVMFDDEGGIDRAVQAEEQLQANYEYYLTIPRQMFENIYNGFAELRLQLFEQSEMWSDVLEKLVPTKDLIAETKNLISEGKRMIWKE